MSPLFAGPEWKKNNAKLLQKLAKVAKVAKPNEPSIKPNQIPEAEEARILFDH
jgi:hypothetical protein